MMLRPTAALTTQTLFLKAVGEQYYSYITIYHDTIVSIGNTNGVAMQNGSGLGYDHLTVTNNLLAGFGYTLTVGGSGASNTNITYTDNVLSNHIQPGIGLLYGWENGNSNL